jgi:tRNA (mo5U34)-methyltransferase
LWFHAFALARGIYTPGIARDHGYRHAVLGADRFAGRSVLDVGAFDGFCSFLAALDACSRSTTSSTSTGSAIGSA